MTEKPSVTLQGTVEQIIESSHPSEPGKVEISIEGGDELYREIRIDNTLTDEDGAQVSLKKGAEVEIRLEAETKATTPRNTGKK